MAVAEERYYQCRTDMSGNSNNKLHKWCTDVSHGAFWLL